MAIHDQTNESKRTDAVETSTVQAVTTNSGTIPNNLAIDSEQPIGSDSTEARDLMMRSVEKNKENIDDLAKQLASERLNNITIFGIFASLVTFLSVEIQIFKHIDSFWLLVGLTAFLVSSLLLFSFSLHAITHNKLKWKDFFSTPIFFIFLLFLFLSFTAFFVHSNNIQIDVNVQEKVKVKRLR